METKLKFKKDAKSFAEAVGITEEEFDRQIEDGNTLAMGWWESEDSVPGSIKKMVEHFKKTGINTVADLTTIMGMGVNVIKALDADDALAFILAVSGSEKVREDVKFEFTGKNDWSGVCNEDLSTILKHATEILRRSGSLGDFFEEALSHDIDLAILLIMALGYIQETLLKE